jgi:hypothetical protein
MSLIGRYTSPPSSWQPLEESASWIGKPWRRIELLTRRYFYLGEEVERERDLTFHFGSWRLGFGITLILSKGRHDYSDEPNQ